MFKPRKIDMVKVIFFKVLQAKVSLLLLCLMIEIQSHSQILINQSGASIYISSVNMSIDGGLLNQGTITNIGTIMISGDWSNLSQYNASSGTIILNGDLSQNINHSAGQFYNLQLQGSGEKILLDDAEVINNLQFSSSLLTTQGTAALVIRQGATIINPSVSAYVNGLLFHEGSGKKFYPLGTKNNYAPITLENVSGTNPLVGIQLFEPNTNAQPGADLISISANRYWQLTERGTSAFTGSPVTLTLAPDEDISSPSTLVVAEADNQSGPYRSLGQSTITLTPSVLITSNIESSGKYFALASTKIDANTLLVPNVLSPLATDSRDNTIRIYGNTTAVSPDSFEFSVFSRWGNVLFHSTSLSEMETIGWNGMDSGTGTSVSNGVYTYLMRGKFINGKSFDKSGSITMFK